MDKLKEATLLLRRASWTRNVSGEALNGMLEHATFKSYSRKSLIFRLGAPSSTFYGVAAETDCTRMCTTWSRREYERVSAKESSHFHRCYQIISTSVEYRTG